MIKDILLLGDEALYQKSTIVAKEELDDIHMVIKDLHDTLMAFRNRYGVGRAIAAPQISVFKRLIYMHIDKPFVFINPVLTFEDDDMMEVLDDCMCFPNLMVRVKRYKKCTIQYNDENFKDKIMQVEGDLSELIQHEYDHLYGILATMRAIDHKSLFIKN